MAFAFKLNLSLSADTGKNAEAARGLSAMGDWAKRAFERMKDAEGDEHLRIQHELMVRHQIGIEAPDRWLELRNALKDEIQDFSNLRPDYLTIHESEDVLLNSPNREIKVSFSREHPKISYAVEERRSPSPGPTLPNLGTFSFRRKDEKVWPVLDAGKGTTPFDKTGVPLTVAEVAEFLLDKLTLR
jgi:hypothetical protein